MSAAEPIIDAWIQHPSPEFRMKLSVEQLDRLGLDDEARRLFLHDNSARLFGLR